MKRAASRILTAKIKGFMEGLEKTLDIMHEHTLKLCNERGDRIMKLEMTLNQIRLECVARGLYNMAETIDEVL